jgi:Ca2+-binding RTX toxin-like protein
LLGLTGNDTLAGGSGSDFLVGGTGRDTFRFDADWAGQADLIYDFDPANDSIQLSKGAFATIGPVGSLAANAFERGLKSSSATTRVLYDYNSGDVFYDSDGSGPVAPIKVVTLQAVLDVNASHFLVI